MKALQLLPENYREIFSVNLDKNKKLSLTINMFALILSLALAGVGHLLVPFNTLFASEEGIDGLLIRYLVLGASIVVYIVLHEAVHAIAMKLFGCKKVSFGFTGLYVYAGTHEYFKKVPYLFIALAPVIIWGIVLTFVCIMVPISWFWIFFIVQITNISGAVGDLYVTARFLTMPKDILVQDVGVSMTVFAPVNTENEKQS